MKKWLKNVLILIITTVFLLSIVGIFYYNSDYYYSKKLVVAINNEDLSTVQKIIQKKPTCINKYPSITPKWWHSIMNYRVCYPLTTACDTDNLELITVLLENGADPNCNDGLTPLSVTYSTKHNNWYAVSQTLIEYGASLDYTTEYSSGNPSALQDILQGRSGKSLLASEYDNDNNEVILAFSYAINNCDHNNVNWMTVLQHSVSNNRIEIVELLLNKGYCNVNDTSVGMTALMFASRDSTREMVEFLLKNGADINLKSFDGKTAYDYAVEKGETEIAELLRTESKKSN